MGRTSANRAAGGRALTAHFLASPVPAAAARLQVQNPSDETLLAKQGVASAEQINRAMEASAAAWRTWKETTDAERAGWLRKLADELEARKPRIAT